MRGRVAEEQKPTPPFKTSVVFYRVGTVYVVVHEYLIYV